MMVGKRGSWTGVSVPAYHNAVRYWIGTQIKKKQCVFGS